MNINPHDLLWIKNLDALVIDGEVPDWLLHQDFVQHPVVVRREVLPSDWIPVGIRGSTRSQRLAAKVHLSDIEKCVTPEQAMLDYQAHFKELPFAAIQALQDLIALNLPWQWGVTGSTAYQLVTKIAVMNANSDLDLIFRSPFAKNKTCFMALYERLNALPCKIDAQIETPFGAFALKEYIRSDNVMLKTPYGPIMTNNPWAISR